MRSVRWKAAVVLGGLVLFTGGNAIAENGIRIAAIYSLTGRAVSSSRLSLESVRMAVKEVNRRGGLLGKPFSLVEIDNQSTPIGSKAAAMEAVRQGVVAIVGSVWSSHSLAVARVAQEHSIPMVTNISTHPDVTRVGDFIFRACFTDPFQGLVMARFAREELEARSAVVVTDVASDYSVGLAREFVKHFEKAGGEVLREVHYKHHQESFEETIRLAGKGQPEILFIPGHDESGAIFREADIQGLPAVCLGGDGWETEKFLELVGRIRRTGYFCSHWHRDADTEASRRFVALWEDRARSDEEDVNAAAALAYDAVMMIADALERAGSTDRNRLRASLAQTRDFEGVTGRIRFNEQGDPVKDALIMEVSGGEIRHLQRVTPLGVPEVLP